MVTPIGRTVERGSDTGILSRHKTPAACALVAGALSGSSKRPHNAAKNGVAWFADAATRDDDHLARHRCSMGTQQGELRAARAAAENLQRSPMLRIAVARMYFQRGLACRLAQPARGLVAHRCASSSIADLVDLLEAVPATALTKMTADALSPFSVH